MPHPCADSRYFTLDELRDIKEAVDEAVAIGDWSDADRELTRSRDWKFVGKETEPCGE